MKILIVDDHSLFREGVSHLLRELEEGVEILDAPDFDCALQLVANYRDLDLVLLDLNIPGRDGFSALEEFTSKYPVLPVVMLSASIECSDIQKCIDLGAVGYIPKDTSSSVMLNALRLILSGGIYLPPVMINAQAQHSQDETKKLRHLTKRQLEVLALLSQGRANKQIARDLNLAEVTVKMHVTAIFKLLDVKNRTQAAMAADKLGLVEQSKSHPV